MVTVYRIWTAIIVGAALLTIALPMAAIGAEDVPLADGASWVESSRKEKVAYLVGAGNMMVVEYLFQTGSKKVPTDDQTIIQRFYSGMDGFTLNELIEGIDKWYADNPDKMKEPVLVVIWKEVIEPGQSKK